jgi:hypothetical protein
MSTPFKSARAYMASLAIPVGGLLLTGCVGAPPAEEEDIAEESAANFGPVRDISVTVANASLSDFGISRWATVTFDIRNVGIQTISNIAIADSTFSLQPPNIGQSTQGQLPPVTIPWGQAIQRTVTCQPSVLFRCESVTLTVYPPGDQIASNNSATFVAPTP